MAQASPPSERFDPDFYRREYPDVAASGIDPWDHYDGWGRAEGRLPWRLRALVAERDLWAGLDVGARGNLARLAGDADARERGRALWALMVWHAAEGDWPAARAALDRLLPDRAARGYQRGPGVGLLAVAILARTGAPPRTAAALLRCLARRGETADTALARGLLARAAGADPAVALLAPLAPVYARAGLAPPALHGADGPLLDRLAAPHAPPGARWHLARARDRLRDRLVGAGPGDRRAAPLVSVIVPAKDAAATLPTALAGLVAQSWRALEILVVDDGSTDATRAVARAWARRDRRIRVLAGPGQGAYAARNAGMAAARGAYLTVHDADDWSHPARIAEQVRPLLEDPALAATVSHLVRLSPDGVPIRWRMEPAEGWVHRNLSSLMLRAGVRARLGFWDRVRAGGDSEYLERLVAAFGPDALADVRPGLPLSFVRSGPETLTRAATTHIRTRVFGPRRDYETAAQRWHARTLAMAGLSAAGQGRGGTARDAARAAALHLPERPARRPFAAPPVLGVGDPEAPLHADDLVRRSPLFDARWYLAHNSDVRADGIDPALHYVRSGAAQGRDPGPAFSTTGYRAAGAPGFANPLVHYETAGRLAGRAALPQLPGALAEAENGAGGARVLVCGHLAGPELYGAERSLLDMLARLVAAGKVPVVAIPRGDNPAYLDALRARAAAVAVMPLPWWHVDRPPHRATLAALEGLIATHRATEVHANTVVLQAPRLAGRAAGVPVVVHLREMPGADATIRAAILGAPGDPAPPPPEAAATIRAALLAEADRFVANSAAVAAWLDAPGRVEVVGNRVDPALFLLPAAPVSGPGAGLCLGMISSNIAKKGIAEAVAVAQAAARALAGRKGAVRLRLVGPASADLAALGPLPAIVETPGYAAGPAEALAGIDVVLSLSRVPESFGRTVLEAMAAGRPVIAWDRGHPPALIGRGAGAGGIVVPADDIAAAAAAVAALADDRALLAALGTAARARARALLANEGETGAAEGAGGAARP